MRASPRVSVVIPHFNGERYLPAALRSLEQQTFADWEVVLVDDGSAEESRAQLGNWRGGRVQILGQRREGAGVATQRGIAAARGEYVAFLDQDDLFHPRKLEVDVALLDARPEIDLAFCGYQLIDAEGRPLGGPQLPALPRYSYRDLLRDYRIGPNATATARRSALQAAKPWSTSLQRYYDVALLLGVARLRPANVAATPEALLFYRRHPGQLSSEIEAMRAEWAQLLSRLREEGDASAEDLALAQSNMSRYFAFLEYEQGRYGAGLRQLARGFGQAPAAALADRRNWLVGAGCVAGWLLPAPLHRLAERLSARWTGVS